MPDISHPHKSHEELSAKAFDLAKRNLFQKQLPTKLNNKISALENEVASQIGTSSQLKKLRKKRDAIISEFSRDYSFSGC